MERNKVILMEFLEGKKLREIGERYGITRERVGQICQQMLKRLGIVPRGTRKRNLREIRKRLKGEFLERAA